MGDITRRAQDLHESAMNLVSVDIESGRGRGGSPSWCKIIDRFPPGQGLLAKHKGRKPQVPRHSPPGAPLE
jgi:hypothetical protein